MATYGAFGKIPAYGDFLRFGLPADFLGPWDRWLQSGLLAGRAALGDSWDEAYMTAPIWRFSLAAGACGPAAVEGVLMASVDRVGRQFPLTLARTVPNGGDPIADHLGPAAGARFAALEDVALAALDDDCTRDRLAERLADPSIADAAWAGARTFGGLSDGYLRFEVGPQSETGVATVLATGLAARLYRRPAVFSAEGIGGQRWIVAEGLPPAHHMRDLFDQGTRGNR